MPAWSFACPDWEDRLRCAQSLVPNLPLDKAAAARAVGIFNKLRLPDVAGNPTMAEAAGDWFRDIVSAACGSLDPKTGIRHVPEIFALVPKKNSKTTGGAAIMLTLMLLNDRPRAEMLLVGPTQEIADLAFQQAAGMIEADPDGFLQKRFLVQEHLKTITCRVTKAKLKIKTFDMKVMTGAKPVAVLLDELHIMSTFSYASRVIGQIRGGLIANPESLMIVITTQSDLPPAGAFKAELARARGVRDGRITDDARLLPILYEFPEAMQRDKARPWAETANWPMVLPNLGRSITIERLEADFKTAQALGDEEIARWASQHLNVEIGMALHTDRWIGADYWTDSTDESLTLDSLIERSEVCVVGLDGGGLDDLFGLAVLGRCKRTRDWLLWCHAWAHSIVLERRADIAEQLRDLQRAGELTICETATDDLVQAAAIVARLKSAGKLPAAHAVGLDPQGVSAMVDELASRGLTTDQLVGIGQGYRLTGAVWGMERKLKDGTLWHADQALMRWCVANARPELKGNAVLITKQVAGKAKIDPLMAALNAVMLMGRNPEATGQARPELVYL